MMSQGCGPAKARRADKPRTHFLHYSSLFLTLMPWVMAGCQSPDQTAGDTARAAHRRTSPMPDMSMYSFRYTDSPPVFDVADLKSFLREFRDEIVILDFWASWSRRSREELSTLAGLNGELSDQGLRVVAVNFDPPEAWTSRTVPTLLGAGANFPCVLVRRGAQEKLRRWLAPDWKFDLPARFVLDRRGRVIARSLSNTPIATVLAEARKEVSVKPRVRTVARRTSPGAAQVAARLVNVATGEWDSLPLSPMDASSPTRLADRVVSIVLTRLDRAKDESIAILPFLSATGGLKAGAAGVEVAEQVRRGLRRHGFFDVIGVKEASRLIAGAGISAAAIDHEPSVVRGRLAVDYVVIGRIAGGPNDQSGRRALAATDREE